ncbi:MAG: flavin reductase family protein [Candidatus Bathyarchaeia archaeon]
MVLIKEEVEPFKFIDETEYLLKNNGLLLCTMGKDKKPNLMTIGWGLIGTMWRQPFFVVAVRASRYTYKLIEEHGEFTVCLPSNRMERILDFCGSKSGRDFDKFKELAITPIKSNQVEVPFVAECPVHYECKVAYKVKVKPGELDTALEKEVYPSGDYHTIYFGRIKGVYAEKDALKKLPKIL